MHYLFLDYQLIMRGGIIMKKTIYVCISAILLMCLIALITYSIPDLKIKMLVSFLIVLAGIYMIRVGIIQKKR